MLTLQARPEVDFHSTPKPKRVRTDTIGIHSPAANINESDIAVESNSFDVWNQSTSGLEALAHLLDQLPAG